MSKNPYLNFKKFVLRTPLLPLNFYLNLTSKTSISDNDFKELIKNPITSEAIFLASPSLHSELNRWQKGILKDDKKIARLKSSLLKYVARFCSRPTPFGLFAGFSVGAFDNFTDISLEDSKGHKRHTRLDMNYLVALSKDLAEKEEIKKSILFYPNTSIYEAGNQLRYVEYKYVNSKRHHHIVAVDSSSYLLRILSLAGKGALLKDLASSLVDEEITVEEASSFIEELVESQLLVSELEPTVSGPDFLSQLSSALGKIEKAEPYLEFLEEISRKLKSLDKQLGNSVKNYTELGNFIEQLGTKSDISFLFQTDLAINTKKNVLDNSVSESIKRGISFLNRISIPPQNTLLSRFRDSFYNRFEEREVPLSKVLDQEIGISYKGEDTGDVSPLVDDLVIPERKTAVRRREFNYSDTHKVIRQKLIDSTAEGKYKIVLTDDDFQGFEENWNDLPDTISALVEIVKIDGFEKIKIRSMGGSSAANLLGRFGHVDSKLFEHTRNIVDTEKRINKDKILAEIVHLPESRVGNILIRPNLRDYEIPYLAKSILPETNKIPLDDLYVTAKFNTRIELKSKKLNKEIIPRLTNAHNFSFNSLPVYNFLSDMQTQNLRPGISFSIGPFAEGYRFLPRIEYENLILREASWTISPVELEPLFKTSEENLLKEMNSFRKHRKIPELIVFVESDNELLLNLKNIDCIKLFLGMSKKKDKITISEFLFDENGLVKGFNENEVHTNQLVISFYNNSKLQNEQ